MHFSEFQNAVVRTQNSNLSRNQAIANYAMGLAGEVGEVVEPLKKHLFHDKDLDYTNMAEELGDIMWYVSSLATTLGLDLAAIVQQNIDKLNRRWPDGFQNAVK